MREKRSQDATFSMPNPNMGLKGEMQTLNNELAICFRRDRNFRSTHTQIK